MAVTAEVWQKALGDMTEKQFSDACDYYCETNGASQNPAPADIKKAYYAMPKKAPEYRQIENSGVPATAEWTKKHVQEWRRNLLREQMKNPKPWHNKNLLRTIENIAKRQENAPRKS